MTLIKLGVVVLVFEWVVGESEVSVLDGAPVLLALLWHC